MRYVTVQMIAARAKRHPDSVMRLLKASQTKLEKFPGVRGYRIAEKDANRLIAGAWPNVPPLGAVLSAPLSQV